MPHITIHDSEQGYLDLVNMVLNHGENVAPRGEPTREIQALTIELTDPHRCIVQHVNRKANLAIGAAEALQLVGGISMPELMVKIAPNFAKFLDGGAFFGAYGPRVRHQLPRIEKILGIDESSRRAVVSIWRDSDLFVEGSNDYPCTLGFTFQVRNGLLDMHTHMRSNDVWWGYTYDVMQFCFLQLTMARRLGFGVGSYFHHADSFHLYDRDMPAARQLEMQPHDPDGGLFSGIVTASWESVRRICYAALTGDVASIPEPNRTARQFCQLIEDRINR